MMRSKLLLGLVVGVWLTVFVLMQNVQKTDLEESSLSERAEGLVSRSNLRLETNDDYFIYQDRVLSRVPFAHDAVSELTQNMQDIQLFLGDSVQLHVMLLPSASVLDPMTQAESRDEQEAIHLVNANIKNANVFDVFEILNDHNEERLYYFTDQWWTSKAAYYASIPLIEELGFIPERLDTFQMHHELNVLGAHRLQYVDINEEPLNIYLWEQFNPVIDVTIARFDKDDLSYQTLLYAKSRRGFDALVEAYYRYATIPGKGKGSVLVMGDYNAKFMVPWLIPYYEEIHLSNLSFDNRSVRAFREMLEQAGIEDIVLIGSYANLMDAATTQSIYNWIEEEKN